MGHDAAGAGPKNRNLDAGVGAKKNVLSALSTLRRALRYACRSFLLTFGLPDGTLVMIHTLYDLNHDLNGAILSPVEHPNVKKSYYCCC